MVIVERHSNEFKRVLDKTPTVLFCLCMPACTLSCLSHVLLYVTLWTVAHQAHLSMEFSRQEYWSGLAFPSPGDLPDSGIKPGSPALQADSLPSEPPGKPKFSVSSPLSHIPYLHQAHFQPLVWIRLSFPG